MQLSGKSGAAKLPRVVNLQDLYRGDEAEERDPNKLPKEAFKREDVVESWMDFAYGIKKQDLDFFSTLSSFLPMETEEGYTVIVHNKTQESDILKLKPKLLGHVRKLIRNYDFEFSIIVNTEEAKDIAVTPQEKYAKLKEKNELLDDLRKKLELGF